ncbi:MAG: acetyl-CoA decarbonylase/synthase complex subunit gamma [Desulfohalobiaceae bacterium]|nr:acetyl-CoA decarbonylase/synthase complex subunit gamma [Desulfohalobiaceae bacterium]
MGLTGIQIFKMLPQTNCKECGAATCLAFAMNLAAGKAELDQCPYVSDEAREKLAEASAPPIRAVKIGKGVRAVTVGGETVEYRHEKTFFNQPPIAGVISSDMPEEEMKNKLTVWNAFQFERVGYILRPELVALKDANGDKEAFAAKAKYVAENTEFNLVLMSQDKEVMQAGIEACGFKRPLIYAATKDNVDDFGQLALDNSLPLAVKADSVEELPELTDKLMEKGLKDLVLDPGSRDMQKSFQDTVGIRRAALRAKNRSVGFPTITFPCEMASNLDMETVIASMFIAKYGGIMVLSDFISENLFSLLLERLNIYTDPQRPMTVQQGIFEIGKPDENSPVLVTTNFALTYFIVAGEIESSKVPSWLLVKDSEGLSVLTAWAAGNFAGDDVGAFVKKSGIADKVSNKELIIPGYAAAIVGEMEDEIPDWTVTVGPREAAHIPAFLKSKVSA